MFSINIERTNFYKALSEFNSDFFSSVNFNQEDLTTLLKQDYNQEDFQKTLNSIIERFNSNQSIYLPNYLATREKNELLHYFLQIGSVDARTQIELLKRYERIFEKKNNECLTLEKQEGALCKKMGVIIGIIIFIIVV